MSDKVKSGTTTKQLLFKIFTTIWWHFTITVPYSPYKCIAVACSVLPCTVSCNVVQCIQKKTAICSRNAWRLKLHPAKKPVVSTVMPRTALHCTALHCNLLHCTALHCSVTLNYSTLQYTTCSDPRCPRGQEGKARPRAHLQTSFIFPVLFVSRFRTQANKSHFNPLNITHSSS